MLTHPARLLGVRVVSCRATDDSEPSTLIAMDSNGAQLAS
jgi:hypothetical protein